MPRPTRGPRLCCERLEDRCQPSASLPTDLTPLGDQLYFVAEDGIHGRELFVNDGTAGGTRLVRDINPGPASSGIRFLTPFGDRLLFTASDGVNDTQIHNLARGEWVMAPENLIFDGPIGNGKKNLAIALGVEATKQKRRVLFTRAPDLVPQLLEARYHL